MKKIVFAEPIHYLESEILDLQKNIQELGHIVEFYLEKPSSEEDIVNRCFDAHMVIVSNYPLKRILLERLTNLEHIGVAFSGLDHIDLNYCREKGIRVSNTPGYSTQAVAEQTILMTLMLLRNAIKMHELTLASRDRGGFLGQELAGKTVGIIGFGKIGRRVAELFDSFGSNILIAEHPSIIDSPYPIVSINELLRTSDIVTLHVPLKEGNYHLLSRDRIFSMKKGSYLINVARGKVVDYEALRDALINRHLAGAALDVYEIEPPLPNDYPLLKLPNVILFPHTAYATQEAISRRFSMLKHIILNWLMEEESS
ncbi:MAG: hydroxyacid dehydrogenase [Bacteroidales bacterium]|nr:hydroxyacid dehydrogenase [Bacteroidales bacterium]